MKILLAKPRGFCAGVDRAITIVERALEQLGAPVFVKHEVVHNRFVVDSLRQRGAIFIENIEQVPDGATLIFSAHGVSQSIRQQAKARALHVFDATCPLVTKVHMQVARYSRNGYECILIGHAGHPEVEGTLGQYHNVNAGIYLIETTNDVDKLTIKNPQKLGVFTQTTLSVDDTKTIIQALKRRFPHMQLPKRDDICYATQNRQDAVKLLAEQVDLVLVVGSSTSSNSNRLRELAEAQGCIAYLIDETKHLQRDWFNDNSIVGITAGASAPEILVQAIVKQLQQWSVNEVQELSGIDENMIFALPKTLR